MTLSREVAAILDDPIAFVERLTIRTKSADGALRTFGPMWQETERWVRLLVTSPRRRFFGLKPRQVAYTTGVQAVEFHRCLTSPTPRRVIQVAHDVDTLIAMSEALELFYDELPPELQDGLVHRSRKQFQFAHNGAGFSRILAGGAGQGRGRNLSAAHFTEMAFYRRGTTASGRATAGDAAENVWSSVNAALSSDSQVYVETTGNGPSGLAYKLWKQARTDPEWEYEFVPWSECERYRLHVERTDEFLATLTPEEETLAAPPFNLDAHQLNWRRDKITREAWTPLRFRYEFPLVDTDPFHLSSDGWFDADHLARAIAYANHDLARDMHTIVRVFHRVGCRCGCGTSRDHEFFLGADTSGGVRKDWAWGHVFRGDGLQVCAWQSNTIGVQRQAELISEVGSMYGGDWGRPPIASIERNNHGRLVIRRLRALGSGIGVTLAGGTDGEEGLWTSRETKREILTFLREQLAIPGRLIVEDALTLLQASDVIETSSGEIRARLRDADELDHKDDGVMALAFAVWGMRHQLAQLAPVGAPGRAPSRFELHAAQQARVAEVVQGRWGRP